MQSNTTLKKVSVLSKAWLMTLVLLLTGTGALFAQTYVNGNLSTGSTTSNGTAAPAGYTWSEVQDGNENAGFVASTTTYSIADDFTVPAGETWNLSSMKFYAYSTGFAGTTSPFNAVYIRIYNTDPSVGNPAPIFGDFSTNRFASSSEAMVYRIFYATPGTTRKVWEVNANINVTLPAGTYWVEFGLGGTVASFFLPPSTVVGTTTQPGNNALQRDLTADSWFALEDIGGPQDMPFSISYTNSCVATVTISSTSPCSPATLTAAGADNYTWSPATGLSATSGATVTASPTTATTYTVTGTDANGCIGAATVVVGVGASSAVLSGSRALNAALVEDFDAGVPATWTTINRSQPVGSNPSWTTGSSGVFTAYNGHDESYVASNYNAVSNLGDIISNWLITPEVTINNGDKLEFWTRTVDFAEFADRMQVRLSTAGASTDVGATNTSVGDFSTLLVDINPNYLTFDPDGYPEEWTRYEVTFTGLAGPTQGRIGFRHFVEDGGPFGNNSDYIGLDAVRIMSVQSPCVTPTDVHNLVVNITGGTAPYTVVYSDGTTNYTVNNYTSGAVIPVTTATTANYTLVSVTDANGCETPNLSGSYVADLGGAITSIPTSVVVCVGSATNIEVTTVGSNISYQWQVSTDGGITWNDIADGAEYTGVNTSTLTILNGNASMAGYIYRVVYGNDCASNNSPSVAVVIGTSTTITSQPVSATACSGDNVSFVVGLSDVTPVQWQSSLDGGATWNDIPGATTETLDLSSVLAALNGSQYRVALAGCNGTVYSDVATLTVTASAEITAQPTSTFACDGADATFSVTATGDAVAYQWQVSTDGGTTWTDIAGATGASYTVNGVASSDNGNQYQVVVSNTCATVTSDAATLTVGSTAAITTQPSDVTACEGSNATVSVVATNAGSYQWQVSTDGGATWNDIAGATADSYSIAATVADNGSQYRVVIGSCPSSITSDVATVTVDEAAAITAQPVSVNGCSGADVTFTVTASGANVTYQWQESTDGGSTWNDIAGATGASHTITGVAATDNGNQYQVVVSNACATVTSDVATLSVGATAAITTQPTDITLCENNDATFTVVATDATSYQWQVSTDGGTTWNDIAGATSDSYTISGTTVDLNGNQYRVLVGSCPTAIESDAATLTVNALPSITTQPTNVSVCADGSASFAVVASNATSYQWQESTDGGTTWTDISGATSDSYTLTTGLTDGTQYQVVITNSCGTATSDAVTLTVNPLPNVTINGPTAAVCSGSTITLAGAGADSYSWDNGVTDNTPFVITSSTEFTVVGTNTATGCMNSATIAVSVNPTPEVVINANTTEIPAGGSVTLTAPVGNGTYVWMLNNTVIPGATGNTYEATEAGVYTLEITANGCTGSGSITMTVAQPNYAFLSPNPNDGNFAIRVTNPASSRVMREVMVFDRKGARVYAKVFVSSQGTAVETMNISLPNVANGAYFVSLYENGYVVKTVLIYINK
jgi:hypothetical protein